MTNQNSYPSPTKKGTKGASQSTLERSRMRVGRRRQHPNGLKNHIAGANTLSNNLLWRKLWTEGTGWKLTIYHRSFHTKGHQEEHGDGTPGACEGGGASG